ncbi:MAG TPA: hypothetical protein VK974_02615 [Methylophilaceae bacterium]|nr:hypothetical protein [Methylophilaceae bacterium]
MKPTLHTEIEFTGRDHIKDFIRSEEPDDLELKKELVRRIKSGESLLAITEFYQCPLALKSSSRPALIGTEEGDKLVMVERLK